MHKENRAGSGRAFGERVAGSGRLSARREECWEWENMDKRGLGMVVAQARPHLHGKHVPLVVLFTDIRINTQSSYLHQWFYLVWVARSCSQCSDHETLVGTCYVAAHNSCEIDSVRHCQVILQHNTPFETLWPTIHLNFNEQHAVSLHLEIILSLLCHCQTLLPVTTSKLWNPQAVTFAFYSFKSLTDTPSAQSGRFKFAGC